MFGFLRRIGDALVNLFKKKAKEVADDVVGDVKEGAGELVDEAIDAVKEELRDIFGAYTIQGKSHGLPRRVYQDGTVRVGSQVFPPGS